MQVSTSDRDPFDRLAEEFALRVRRGERPSLSEYMDRYPELAGEIERAFPAIVLMEQLKPEAAGTGDPRPKSPRPVRPPTPDRLGDYRIVREIGRGGMGVVYEAEQESLGRRVALKVLSGASLIDPKQVLRFEREARAAARLHHTNIVPIFGVGEHEGTAYYVMQLIPGHGLDMVLEDLRRLRRSRVPADGAFPLDSGEDHGLAHPPPPKHAYDMTTSRVAWSLLTGRFAEGGGSPDADPAGGRADSSPGAPSHSLTTDEARSGAGSSFLPGQSAMGSLSHTDRRYFRSVALVGLQVAGALEYANRQGVLHRDIKPSNLLLDSRGNVWVTDFGLAKMTESQDITHTGDILGTIRYMAPERFRGSCDARSDVYSLGLTLYELVALRPAYEATDRHSLIDRVLNESPAPLRRLAPSVPSDLETIISKAIARHPAERYATPATLAEDLKRFLDGRTILARRVSAGEHAWRWCRRNRAAAGLTAALALALVGGTLISTTLAIQTRFEANRSQLAERKAVEAEADARRDAETAPEALYDADMQLAAEISEGEDGTAEAIGELLDAHDLRPGEDDLREFSWFYQRALLDAATLTVVPAFASKPAQFPSQCAPPIAFTADGLLVVVDGRGGVSSWDPDARRETRRAAGGPGEATGLAVITPDGMTYARLDASGRRVHLASTLDRRPAGTIETERPVIHLAFSPEGSMLAAMTDDGATRVWRTGSRSLEWTVPAGGGCTNIALAFRGAAVALADFPDQFQFDLEVRGPATPVIVRRTATVYSVAISPGGGLLAAGDSRGHVLLLDTTAHDREPFPLVGHAGNETRLVFSPDGSKLASGGLDGVVNVWDVRSRSRLRRIKGQPAAIGALAFSRDGRYLASVDEHGRIQASSLTRRSDGATFVRPPARMSGCWCIAVSRDGRWAVTGHNGIAWVWDCQTGHPVRWLPVSNQPVSAVAISPDGRIAVTGDSESHLKLWDLRSGRLERILYGRPTRGLGNAIAVGGLAFSPDGRLLAAGFGTPMEIEPNYGHQVVKVWDPNSGDEVAAWEAHENTIPGLAFSPDGSRLATASHDGTVKLWDPRTSRRLSGWNAKASRPPGAGGVSSRSSPIRDRHDFFLSVAIAPDGGAIAAASDDGSIHVRDLDTLRERFRIRGHSLLAYSLAFSADGRTLASAGFDRLVKLWNVQTGRELRTLKGHADWVTGVGFASEGRFLMSVDADGMLAGWNAPPAWDTRGEEPGSVPHADEMFRVVEAVEAGELDESLASRPTADRWFHRGSLRGRRRGRWSGAAADLTRALDAWRGSPMFLPEDEVNVRHFQILALLASRDDSAARGAIAQLLARFSSSTDPALVEKLAWNAALAPGMPASTEVLQWLGPVASPDVPAEGPLSGLTLGALLYRAGRFEDSVRVLERRIGRRGGQSDPYDCAFLAMAHHQLGHQADSVRWTRRFQDSRKNSAPSRFWDGIEVWLVEREAAALVLDPRFPIDPFAR